MNPDYSLADRVRSRGTLTFPASSSFLWATGRDARKARNSDAMMQRLPLLTATRKRA